MTEDEALTKWCPQALTGMFMSGDTGGSPISVVQGCNRIVSDVPEIGTAIMSIIETTGATRCLGRKCMAWRWKQRIANQDVLDRERQKMMVGTGYYRIEPVYEDTEHGFCGLATKP